jgi:hypothetical protein
VIEVERTVSRVGTVALAGRVILAAEILAGRRVGIRIDGSTLMFLDLDTRELLRTRPNPIHPERPSICVAFVRSDRQPARRSSRSGCSVGPRIPA